ncbi:MAG: ABC transporter permease subunit [Pirellulales bacterium]|nr:ABC transporter permease subunit [Pirellulales bacterium]
MAIMLMILLIGMLGCGDQEVRFGAKLFPESQILAEMLWHLSTSAGGEGPRPKSVGDTRVVWKALLEGEIDAYVDYTGTIREETLRSENLTTDAEVRTALASRGILMSDSLGFNNTYAIGMLESEAARLGISKISDLTQHPDLKFGFSTAFVDRQDCWPALQSSYGLPQTDVSSMEHAIAYSALADGAIDVLDLYSTDAELASETYRRLEDDRGVFPEYNAVLLYRQDFAEAHPEIIKELLTLVGRISEEEMQRLNTRVKVDNKVAVRVAGDFLISEFPELRPQIQQQFRQRDTSLAQRIGEATLDHLSLVGVSLLAAVLVGVPSGVISARYQRLGQIVLAAVGIVQTIPALALLVMLMVPLSYLEVTSIGAIPAILALFLYSLLPIVRNTVTGLQSIPPAVRESATALGLTSFDQLRFVELPLASRTIMAGIKTAAVINVGFATLGALIGAGGYGEPIMQGITSQNYGLIMEGALAAAGLAVVVQLLFEGLELFVVPKGLRITTAK